MLRFDETFFAFKISRLFHVTVLFVDIPAEYTQEEHRCCLNRQHNATSTLLQKSKQKSKEDQKTGGEMLQLAFILAFVLIPGLHGALDCPTGNVN